MSTSKSLPLPTAPQASLPKEVVRISTPLFFNILRLSFTAIFVSILVFIAGATKTLDLVANNTVLARSSAIPLAILLIKFAVAGHTITKSAF